MHNAMVVERTLCVTLIAQRKKVPRHAFVLTDPRVVAWRFVNSSFRHDRVEYALIARVGLLCTEAPEK